MQKIMKYRYELDVLRVLACFLVVWQHVTECYYIQPDLGVIKNTDTFTIGWLNSLTPIEVPLFVIISGYLLLPQASGTSTFLRKRLKRILYPFMTWCIIYAIYYVFKRGDSLHDVLRNILHIPVNFGTEIGHMWFIYMISGLYLLTPIISPWLKSCSKQELQGYLCLWALTCCLPYIHLVFPAVLGECFWNPSPTLYYFTGFAGYYVLGYYLRRYGTPAIPKSLLILLAGYLLTVGIFMSRIPDATTVSDLELGWRFCSINIAVSAYAVASLIIRIKWNPNGFMASFIKDCSQKSYAVYFIHLMWVFFFYPVMNVSGLPLYFKIPLTTVCSFLASYLVISLLYVIPKSRKWIG